MTERFKKGLKFVLAIEQAYSDDPYDPGGETVWGITRRAHPEWSGWDFVDGAKAAGRLDEALREPHLMEMVEQLYRTEYWDPMHCDDLGPPGDILAFGAAVNQGVETSTELMQQALGVVQDGVIGPVTLAAARRAGDWHWTDFLVLRLAEYESLSGYPRFGDGWKYRVIRAACVSGLWRDDE